MSGLSREAVKQMIMEWRDSIAPDLEHIRRAQDELLLEIDEEHIPYALTAMSLIIGRGSITMMTTNNTNIGNAGVAVTGGEVHGNITGTALSNATQMQALEGLAKLKASLQASPELSSTEKEDAASAIEDLEGEAQKPDDSRNTGRVRNAFKALMTTISVAKSAEFLYKDVLPHLETLFHLAK
jgi:hypothetical protein